MPLPSALLDETLRSVLGLRSGAKSQASAALTRMQGNVADSRFIFGFADSINSFITAANSLAGTPGLDEHASAEFYNYSGVLSTDISAAVTAARACNDWIVANFPKGGVGNYLLAETMNPDASRVARVFTAVELAGLITALQSFIATLG